MWISPSGVVSVVVILNGPSRTAAPKSLPGADGCGIISGFVDVSIRKGISRHGKVCELRQGTHLRTQSKLFQTGHSPRLSAEPANCQRGRRPADCAEGPVRQVHPLNGEDELGSPFSRTGSVRWVGHRPFLLPGSAGLILAMIPAGRPNYNRFCGIRDFPRRLPIFGAGTPPASPGAWVTHR